MIALTHFNEDFKSPYHIKLKGEEEEYFRNKTIFSLDHLKIQL
jgi:hypothetical protein